MSNRILALSVPATLSDQSSSGRWTASAIHTIIDDHQRDILALQETWMHADAPPCIKSNIAPAHYSVTRVHREIVSGGPTRGGGLAIVSRDELKVKSHPLANGLKVTSFELQLVKFSSRPTSFAILNIYRPSSNSVPTFLDELADVVSSIRASLNDSLLLCGDLNYAGAHSSSVDDNLESVLDSLDLDQLVRSPTREDHLLDVLATDARDAVSGVHVDDAGYIFDHRLMLAKVKFSRPACRVIESTYRNIRKLICWHSKMRFSSLHFFLHQPVLLTSSLTRWQR